MVQGGYTGEGTIPGTTPPGYIGIARAQPLPVQAVLRPPWALQALQALRTPMAPRTQHTRPKANNGEISS